MGSLVLGALHLVPGVTTSVQVMPQNDGLNGRDGTCHGATHCSYSLLLLRLQLLLLRLSYFCNLAVHRVRQMLRHAPAPSSLRRAWHSSSYLSRISICEDALQCCRPHRSLHLCFNVSLHLFLLSPGLSIQHVASNRLGFGSRNAQL